MTAGGVVLVGGRSSRMGAAKASLEWHGSTLLRRVVGLVSRGVDGPVVVVAAPGQELPEAPAGVEVVRDEREGLGPLEGLAVGLAALSGRAEVAYVSSTDVPFLHPAFVRAVVGALAAHPGADVALPLARGFPQPLAAAYSTGLAPLVRRLVASGRLRPAFLFEACRVVRLDEAALLADTELAARDPALESLTNLNDPADYAAARGAPAPAVVVEGAGGVRAATVGQAAEATGRELAVTEIRLNGERVPFDAGLPLAAGDVVAFDA